MLLPVISGFVNAPIGAAALATITGLGAGVAAALANAVDGTGGVASVSFVNASVLGLLDFKGSQDCSANPNYPSASKGDVYIVSVSGKIGGASGTTVEAGDLFTATADNAGGTQASVGTSWVVTQANVVLGTGVATALAIAVNTAGGTLTHGGAGAHTTLDLTSTHTLSSTATAGIQIYNTADQTTNYERLEALYSSNVALIRSLNGGTGTARVLRLSAANGAAETQLSIQRSALPFAKFAMSAAATGTGGNWFQFGDSTGTSTATSGAIGFVAITPTYNQASGSAANTDLLINRTQTAVGSGAQNLIDAQVGAVSKFSVTNTGTANAATAYNLNAVALASFSGNIVTVGAGQCKITFDSDITTRLWANNSEMLAARGNLGYIDIATMRCSGSLQLASFLYMVGQTSSFPALKRSTTIIQSRLADDSGFASLQGKLTTDANATTGLTAGVLSALTNASITITDASGQVYRVPVII